jgi:3',5'-cyclic AMP phosphodiesterase CpdA
VNLLHLSDLHFSQLPQADVWYGQLAEDLKELGCDRLDVLVLSGDLTQRADAREFEAARRFLLRLSTDARLSPGQVVVVPGNHDLDWSLSKAAYSFHRREDYADALEEGRFIAHGTTVVEVRDEAAYRQRFKPFADFYAQIKGTPYPLDYEAQIDVQDFAKENLLVVGFNSAWETDHHFTSRAGIHAEALTRALDRIRRSHAWVSRVKIAVWHHPLASPGEDRVKDHGFLQQLAKAGFRLVLHGHIHKAERSLFRYDMTPDGRRLDIVAAGTFGAPTTEWVPGYPLQYNLLRLSKDRIVVETRRREEPNGAWHPDARWLQGPGKDPLPRYAIALSGEPL